MSSTNRGASYDKDRPTVPPEEMAARVLPQRAAPDQTLSLAQIRRACLGTETLSKQLRLRDLPLPARWVIYQCVKASQDLLGAATLVANDPGAITPKMLRKVQEAVLGMRGLQPPEPGGGR